MLEEKYIQKIKEELDNCKKPLFFFDDDPDGLSSFLLLYRYKKEGRGIPLKAAPMLDEKFLRKAEEYLPDKVFILDVPIVEQDFIDRIKVPIIWVDHHNPIKRRNVVYFNPRLRDINDSVSITEICYNIVKQDLWIAAVGAVGDWQLPPYIKDFSQKYPDLLSPEIKKPEEALFNSRLGKLIKIFSFILKGKISDVYKCMKILTRVEDPYEVLDQKTPRGRFVFKKSEGVEVVYNELLSEAMKKGVKDNVVLYVYEGKRMSFTKELSNELLYKFPDKLIVVGREKSGEVKLSLRSSKIFLPKLIEKSLEGVDGYGGGHEHACGACVKKNDFKRFMDNIKRELKQ